MFFFTGLTVGALYEIFFGTLLLAFGASYEIFSVAFATAAIQAVEYLLAP